MSRDLAQLPTVTDSLAAETYTGRPSTNSMALIQEFALTKNNRALKTNHYRIVWYLKATWWCGYGRGWGNTRSGTRNAAKMHFLVPSSQPHPPPCSCTTIRTILQSRLCSHYYNSGDWQSLEIISVRIDHAHTSARTGTFYPLSCGPRLLQTRRNRDVWKLTLSACGFVALATDAANKTNRGLDTLLYTAGRVGTLQNKL